MEGHAVVHARVDHHAQRPLADSCQIRREVLFAHVAPRDGRGRTVLARNRNAIAHIVFHTGGYVIFADVVRVFALEADDRRFAHFRIHVAVLSIVLPHARPARVSSQIYYGSECPGNASRFGFVCRDFGFTLYQVPVECGSHVDTLREQGSIKRISGSVYLVYAIDAGDSDFLHRKFLNLPDGFRPFLFRLGNAQGNVQERADLVFPDNGIQLGFVQGEPVLLACFEVGHYIDGDFTHLTYLFLDGHFLEPILDVGFDFGVRRDGRRDGLSFCT